VAEPVVHERRMGHRQVFEDRNDPIFCSARASLTIDAKPKRSGSSNETGLVGIASPNQGVSLTPRCEGSAEA
jgi:hypothetical protein